METLFSPVRVGTVTLPNRFVRSATLDFMAEADGGVSDGQVELVRSLARGGVGLIVMGNAYVRRDGRIAAAMLGLDSNERIAGFARLADAAHGEGPARIVAQLNHGGARTPPALGAAAGAGGSAPLAPSPLPEVPEARPFTEEEAAELVSAFAASAVRAREAGLDGVQLHAAHGYLLNQALSPLTNHRPDRYGGGPEGRARLLQEIAQEIRRRVGREFLLLVKLAGTDGLPRGLTLEDSVQVARWAEGWGLDAVEVSGGLRPGMSMRRPLRLEDEGFFRGQARAFRQALSIPVISVHGYRSLAVMREAVESGAADLIALSRPLVREPDLVERFRRGLQEKSSCISCNRCLTKRQPLRCWAEGAAET